MKKPLYNKSPQELEKLVKETFDNFYAKTNDREYVYYVSFPNKKVAIEWFEKTGLPIPKSLLNETEM